MDSRNYRIMGMTCDHCVLSVREEVEELRGVATVDVRLDTGLLAVAGHGFSDDAVAAAVREAGYELA